MLVVLLEYANDSSVVFFAIDANGDGIPLRWQFTIPNPDFFAVNPNFAHADFVPVVSTNSEDRCALHESAEGIM